MRVLKILFQLMFKQIYCRGISEATNCMRNKIAIKNILDISLFYYFIILNKI